MPIRKARVLTGVGSNTWSTTIQHWMIRQDLNIYNTMICWHEFPSALWFDIADANS